MRLTDTGDSALAIVRAEAARIRCLRRIVAVLFVSFVVVFVPWLIGTFAVEPYHRLRSTSVLLMWCLVVATGLLRMWQRRIVKRTVGAMGHTPLPALSEGIRSDDEETRKLARTAIAPILCGSNAADAPLFDERTRANLRAILASFVAPQRGLYRWTYNEELGIAILRAFEQVGDPESVPIAEALANSRYTRLSQAAREALPGLRQRSHELRQSQTLLRPSEHTEDESSVLMRPAAGIDNVSETLLRVGVGGEVDGDA